MAKPAPQLRPLKFNSFEDVMADVENLRDRGYTAHGNWNLAQTCGHLAAWMTYPMDGFPKPPLLFRPIFWLMKVTVAKRMARNILRDGFKPGTPTAPQSVPAADALGDAQAVDHLRSTIERLRSHQGEFFPSPLFGETDFETLQTVSLKHAELHLGFLEPKV